MSKRGNKYDTNDICRCGKEHIIRKVGGNSEVRADLENLGFVPGAAVTVITTNGGNLIVNVKQSRVAISKEMAAKIMI